MIAEDMRQVIETNPRFDEISRSYYTERLTMLELTEYARQLVAEMNTVLTAIDEQAAKLDAILEKPGSEEH